MLDPIFQEAFCHRPGGHRVLGRELHPLCALDLLALESINSPFLYDGAKCEVQDLVIAVWLLSNDPPADLTVHHLELDEEGRAWLSGLTGKIEMERDCRAVLSYMADYYALPEMFRQTASNPITALGAPWMLATVVYVAGKLHLSLREAWTMGIGQLFWYRASIEEQETEHRIISPEMREEMKKAETNSRSFKMEIGESLADFSKRVGIPEADAAVLLHN